MYHFCHTTIKFLSLKLTKITELPAWWVFWRHYRCSLDSCMCVTYVACNFSTLFLMFYFQIFNASFYFFLSILWLHIFLSSIFPNNRWGQYVCRSIITISLILWFFPCYLLYHMHLIWCSFVILQGCSYDIMIDDVCVWVGGWSLCFSANCSLSLL